MRIRWTPAAAADLQRINDYLKEHHPHYRQPTMRRLYEKIRALKDAPYSGKPGRVEG
ncbi:MAG: type II toxin-antitoxin system RelE/ParE family toxin, partial [Bryobacterales bacterium]|nr:type II toxin-antitoxin system RelE/ParE family toxin [Bryobacterales bacterium]